MILNAFLFIYICQLVSSTTAQISQQSYPYQLKSITINGVNQTDCIRTVPTPVPSTLRDTWSLCMVNEYKAKSTCKVKSICSFSTSNLFLGFNINPKSIENDIVYMNFIDITGQKFSSSPVKSSANITNACGVSLSWSSDNFTRQTYSIDNRKSINGPKCSFEELSKSNGAMKRTMKIPSDVQGNQTDFVLYVDMYAIKDSNSTKVAPNFFPQCADIQLVNDYTEPKTPPVVPSKSVGRLTKNFSR
ncbi:hypothetical protein BKA69DRAFT_1093592 [Paraphysoderma sedebokerense]|nr:hypothetical protein BKA69DRAFT_1093592 [Paraphysoderma sedebokerense]